MNELDKISLMREIITGNIPCDLNHGKGYEGMFIQAIDYLTLPMGIIKSETISNHLVFAICKECIEALQSDEWVLLVCSACGATRWVNRNFSKLQYINAESGNGYDLLLLDGCPDCSGKFGGIFYFQHEQVIGDKTIN